MKSNMRLNYDELAKKFALGWSGVEEAAIPLVFEEAWKRHDGNAIAYVASWYEEERLK